MELNQLEVFVCVAKNLSFSKAAEELYISQPSVSSKINSLEKALGAQLFVRNTKGVSLTKTGLEFLLHARKILSLRDQAIHSVQGDDSNAAGVIDIISSTVPAQFLLPEIIASFTERRPNIVFRVEQSDSRRVEQEMRSFYYDFGMIGTAPDGDRFSFFPVYEDEFVLALQSDALRGSDAAAPDGAQCGSGSSLLDWAPVRISPDDEAFNEFILRSPFIMRETGSGTRKEIEALLSKIGVDPQALRIPAFFPDAHGVLLAVSRGMGVSLVSKVAAKMYVQAGLVTAVEFDSPLFRRNIYLLYNRESWLSPIQQAFADHARQFYLGTVDS